MHPSVTRAFHPKGQQHVISLGPAAPAAAIRRRADMVAVEPFDDPRLEGEALGLWARQTAAVLGNGRPLVEMRSPSLSPSIR